ncbi:flavin-containing monooxygenase [Streptomyces phytohabitans]|uniref:flavin-containing monooxygenase n=1 Tax=Streptomyces phytohabitans TaxID=1150371 RepID=UPI00345BC664
MIMEGVDVGVVRRGGDEGPELDALVVGAGFAGLYQLHLLRARGFSARLVEACEDVGGTWYRNRYPGARCDIESTAYSYSFSPELDQEWEWSERYAAQPEILRYLGHVADRFDLRPHITLNTRVERAVYDEDSHLWTVTTSAAWTVTTRFVVLATGCTSAVKDVDVPGIESFAGRTLHTARWPRDEPVLAGERVGVLGTGCSGVQVVPQVAARAAALTVFQRTPVYALPAHNRPLPADEIAATKADYPRYRRAQRASRGGTLFTPPTRSALSVGAGERTDAYEEGWRSGVLSGLLRTYTDLLTDEAANETVASFVRGKIRDSVTDPDTADALSPRTFPFGTKRPCLESGYYAAFNEPHVRLVDLRRTPLVEVTPRGVRTTEREHPLDTLVLATGFDALTGSQTAIDVRGRGGATLREKWSDGAANHLGLVASGFPNLFTVLGPLSPSVLSNAVTAAEQHVEWIADCLVHLRRHGFTEIDATPQAEREWCAHVAALAERTLYPSVDSWYTGANVAGKPRTFLAYTGGMVEYRARCDAAARDGYAGFALARAVAPHTDPVPGATSP